jgi:hypothetical protein
MFSAGLVDGIGIYNQKGKPVERKKIAAHIHSLIAWLKSWYRLEPEAEDLLRPTILPLLDFFFLTTCVAGLGGDSLRALVYGGIVFSGPGCIMAAVKLKGSIRQRSCTTFLNW